MILGNPAPELFRLRASLLRHEHWPAYHAWIDANLDRVLAMSKAVKDAGDEPAPVLRAQYVYENWMSLI